MDVIVCFFVRISLRKIITFSLYEQSFILIKSNYTHKNDSFFFITLIKILVFFAFQLFLILYIININNIFNYLMEDFNYILIKKEYSKKGRIMCHSLYLII